MSVFHFGGGRKILSLSLRPSWASEILLLLLLILLLFFKKKKRAKLVQGLKALAAKSGEFNFNFNPWDPHDRGESTPKRCPLTSARVPINTHTHTHI